MVGTKITRQRLQNSQGMDGTKITRQRDGHVESYMVDIKITCQKDGELNGWHGNNSPQGMDDTKNNSPEG